MGRYSFRDTVEDCKAVSIFWLNRNDYLCGYRSGSIRWTRAGQETGSIGIEVSIENYEGSIRFQYTQTDRHSGEKTSLDYNVTLVSTQCNFGGKRWWFICPLGNCGRRVGVLYLGGGKYFGCRHCYDLTYESCKDSHKFDRLAYSIGITPKMLKEVF